MILSLNSGHDNFDGYGYSTSVRNMLKSFKNFKYKDESIEIVHTDYKPIIQLHYQIDPTVAMIRRSYHYRIDFSHFESTIAPKNKVDFYKANSKENWVSSPWSKQALVNAGIDEDKVYIYELGIDPNKFTKTLRGTNDKIRFLFIGDHVGNRKRRDLVTEAFQKAFGNNKSYELTIKMGFGSPTISTNWKDLNNLKTKGTWISENIRYIDENVTNENMNSIINFHDIFVFPSEAEGFGLTPLECLATGMPTISTWQWASYSRYLLNNKIHSSIGPSNTNWGYEKDGYALNPSLDSIISLMKHNADNINIQSKIFYDQADQVINDYSYDNVTNKFLTATIDRLGIEMFRSVV
jgi:hypothetical protein